MAARSINIHSPLPRPPKTFSSQNPQISSCRFDAAKNTISGSRMIVCSALQESSTATVSEKKEEAAAKAAPLPAKEAPPKPKKAPAKALPEMMEEDVIPSLRAALEAQGELSQIDLSFKNNTLEGSFLKKDKPYYFWVFFPNGDLTGPKGFSLSSYGSGVSTVEPFLVDEKRITAKLVVFWVRKRLAAQGIFPVWED